MKFNRTLLFVTVLLFIYPNHSSAQQDLSEYLSQAEQQELKNFENADKFFSRGLQASDNRDFQGAVADFAKVIELDPKRWNAYFLRAQILSATQPDQAIADYGKVIELKPSIIGAYLNRSQLLKFRGDIKGAMTDLNSAIALQPNLAGAYNNRSILLWETGKSKDALVDLDKSIELQPNESMTYLIRGLILASLHEYPAAYRDIDRAFQLNPNLMNGRRVDPLIVDHYTEQGVQLANSGDLDRAMVELNKAIILASPVGQSFSPQVEPYSKSLAEALGNRGLIWLRRGNETEAQKDLTECLKLDPTARSWVEDKIHTSGLRFSLNSIMPQQETLEPSTAMAGLLKAAEQGKADAQYNLGIRYLQGEGVPQDYAEAENWLRKAAEQNYIDAQYILGMVLNKIKKNYPEAIKWLRKAAEQGDPRAQNDLGTAYINGRGVAQDYAEALIWYRKAAEQGDGLGQLNVGIIYAKGEGVNPDYVQAYFWLNISIASLDGNPQPQAAAAKQLNEIVKRMSPQQKAEAERLGKEWQGQKEGRIWPIFFPSVNNSNAKTLP